MVNLGGFGGGLLGGAAVTIIIGAVDNFSRTFDKARKDTQQFHRDLRNLGMQLTALGVAGAMSMGKLVKEGAKFEQTQIAFTTMLDSGEKAQAMLEELAQFAARTPFTLEGVEMSAKQLLAMSFEAEELIPVLKSVGDVASGLGMREEGLQRLIYNLGQVNTQTRLTGRELRDFVRAGVPLLGELAKNLEVTEAKVKDMISAGEISADEVVKAFRTMSSEGGKFANLMDKQARTTLGAFSNLKDQVTLLMREFGEVLLPVVNVLVGAMKGLVAILDSLPKPLKVVLLGAAGLATVFALIIGPITLIIGLLPTMTAGWVTLTGAISGATAATSAFVIANAPLLLGIGALITIVWGVSAALKAQETATTDATEAFKLNDEALQNILGTYDDLDNKISELTEKIRDEASEMSDSQIKSLQDIQDAEEELHNAKKELFEKTGKITNDERKRLENLIEFWEGEIDFLKRKHKELFDEEKRLTNEGMRLAALWEAKMEQHTLGITESLNTVIDRFDVMIKQVEWLNRTPVRITMQTQGPLPGTLGTASPVNDFISRPGQPIQPISPQDTLIGVKDTSRLGGTSIIVNIERLSGLDEDEVTDMLQRKLDNIVSVVL